MNLSLLFLSIIFSFQLTAQNLPIIFDENFDNNDKEWLTNYDGVIINLKEGKYTLQRNNDNNTWNAFYQNIFLETNTDFMVETHFQYLEGNTQREAGLYWASHDKENENLFYINPTGKFKITQTNGGKSKTLCDWTTHPSLANFAKGKTGVKLKVSYDAKQKQSSFFIEDTKVFSSTEAKPMGHFFGFRCFGNIKLSIDYLKVYQKQKEVKFVSNATEQLKKENLGTNINSNAPELAPIISADGLTLYYTRGDHPGNIAPTDRQDIWVAEKSASGTWEKSKNLGSPVNNGGNNFLISVSPDNNTLLVGNTYKADGSPDKSGVSITRRTMQGWTLPQTVQIEDFYNYNRYSEYCLAPNGKVLLLCIQREDSYGQKDVYVSFKKEDDTWTAPKNIGTPVNTIGNEIGPFLAADGITMYYSSNGFKGLGNNDIYITRRLDDTWLNWSEPENLGKGINTPNWDAYYVVPASGEYAYMSSSEVKEAKSDIFRINLPEAARPKPSVLISGRVLNAKTKQPLAGQIIYESLLSGKELGVANANPNNGAFKLVLPIGDSYGFLAQAKGFYAVSENIDCQNITEYTEIKKDLYLVPIEKDEIIRLNNLFFDFAKFSLRTESYPELKRLIDFLNSNPAVRIEIGGHTDSVGSDENNLLLSQNRAKSVLDYLIQKGISAQRLTAKGYGETKPLADNQTNEGRQLNRRVEVKILEK